MFIFINIKIITYYLAVLAADFTKEDIAFSYMVIRFHSTVFLANILNFKQILLPKTEKF